MNESLTRRAVLAALPAGLAAARNAPTKKARPLPSVGEFFRFADPTTETPVVRLTNPQTTSVLPPATNHFVSLKGRFLIFSSDRTGTATPFHVDLRTGILTGLAQTGDLDTSSLCLDERGKILYFLDNGILEETILANKRTRTLAENVSAFSIVRPSEFVVVRGGRLEQLGRGIVADNVSSWCLVRPGGKGCAFGRIGSTDEREFWYVSLLNSADAKPKLLAKGRVSNPIWSPDGQSLLLLRDVEVGSTLVSEIHEVCPQTEEERFIARTSQFAAFAPNGDASVFVGASRSKAQPEIILLIRSVQRELTLCEHRASDPVSVHPAFSPDSRRVYFQSDHQGKSALYSVNVELLVEPTASAI